MYGKWVFEPSQPLSDFEDSIEQLQLGMPERQGLGDILHEKKQMSQ